MKVEKVTPYNSPENKAVQIERMFDEIAENYDALNLTLSMGIDRKWRKKGLNSLKEAAPQRLLDVATGTGDLALEAHRVLRPKEIVGVDLSEEMMKIAAGKVDKAGLGGSIRFEKQDCCSLGFADESFDAVTVAFGIRNFENLGKGLREILRVLRPGGSLMILELSTPANPVLKRLYKIYSRLVIPALGRLMSKSERAYRYLPESIAAFPQSEEMAAILKSNGFRNVSCRAFTFGVCSLYLGMK